MSMAALKVIDNTETSGDNSGKTSKVMQFRESRTEIPSSIDASVTYSSEHQDEVVARLINISRFGAKIYPKGTQDFLALGSTLSDVEIRIQGNLVFSGTATVVNEGRAGQSDFTYGLILSGEGLNLEEIEAIIGVAEHPENISSSKNMLSIFSLVKPEFKALVADLNTLFQDLKLKLNMEEERIKNVAKSENQRERMEEQAVNLAISLYTDDFRNIYKKFKELTDQFGADETIVHKRYFRSNFLPIVIDTPFMHRAYSKPLGYAGDYGLMVMFYEYHDSGKTLFDKFKHRYACGEPAAVANKNRVELLSDMLLELYEKAGKSKKEKFKISTIACGPAKEIELFIKDISGKVTVPIEVVCIDHEPKALEYAQTKIRKATGSERKIKSVFLEEDSVMGLIRKRDFVEYISESDVIISAGLYDYLSDRVANCLTSSLYNLLSPSGNLIIGNVSDKNPDKFSMDYFMEWNLVLRNAQDLKNLVADDIKQSDGVKVDVISESLGLNLFLKVLKPSS